MNKPTNAILPKNVNIIGLGYVGLTLGLILADSGFQVRGFDTNKSLVENLKKNKPSFWEKGLLPLLKRHNHKNFFGRDYLARENDLPHIHFISVGTPLSSKSRPDLQYIKSSAHFLGRILKPGDIVIPRSTVPLGTTRFIIAPILEKKSGLAAGKDFYLAFAPERTVEGKALEELRDLPQIIGGINRESGEVAAAIFNKMTKNSVILNSLEEAEMVKLINNAYRTITFSFANELALLCHNWRMDTKKIIEAANSGYARSKIPYPGPGVGGPCLTKDLRILIESGRSRGYTPAIAQHASKINDRVLNFMKKQVVSFLNTYNIKKEGSKIFILGFAFKGFPEVDDIRGSTAVELVKKLKKVSENIFGYDPKVSLEKISGLGINAVTDPRKGFLNANAVILMNDHRVIKNLDIASLIKLAKKPLFIFDAWGLHEKTDWDNLEKPRTPTIITASTAKNFMSRIPFKGLKNVYYKKL